MMMRTLLLILTLLALIGCEPGRCLRHSDCPTGASCKRGVCRLPPNQSTSLAQPADEENQSLDAAETVEQNEEHPASELDASALSMSFANTSTASSDTQSSNSSDGAVSSTELVSSDGSTPGDANVDSGWDAALLARDAARDASGEDQDAAPSSAAVP